MTLDSILEWLDPDKHPFHILIIGAAAGQLVLTLPDSRFKTYATNFLHGFFPSIQVMANGAPSIPKLDELVGTVVATDPIDHAAIAKAVVAAMVAAPAEPHDPVVPLATVPSRTITFETSPAPAVGAPTAIMVNTPKEPT